MVLFAFGWYVITSPLTPLKQTYFLTRTIRLFERGIKGVSLDDETTKTE